MADIAGNCQQVMAFHLFVVCGDTQIHPVPDGGIPNGGGKVFGYVEIFLETLAGVQFLDGHGIQADAGPHQEGLAVAQAHIHRTGRSFDQQAGILAQRPDMRPDKGIDAHFARPDVGGPGREHAQGSLRAEQAAGCLPGRAIPADGKDRPEILLGSHARQLGGMAAIDRFGHFHAPAMVIQRPDDTADERAD